MESMYNPRLAEAYERVTGLPSELQRVADIAPGTEITITHTGWFNDETGNGQYPGCRNRTGYFLGCKRAGEGEMEIFVQVSAIMGETYNLGWTTEERDLEHQMWGKEVLSVFMDIGGENGWREVYHNGPLDAIVPRDHPIA